MKAMFEINPSTTGGGATKVSWQKKLGNYLAVVGTNRRVVLCDRHGDQLESVIPLPGPCTSLDWNKDGELLAITQESNGTLFLWNANSFEDSKLETGMKEGLSLCLWNKHSNLLAICTTKGNLIFYNHRAKRKVPILGKHTKRITCGAWNTENLLALAGEDHLLTISNVEGDTLRQTELRTEPHNLQFSLGEGVTGSIVSVVLGSKTVFLYDIEKTKSPLEMAFQNRYGEITAYHWFGEGQLLVGFSKGYLVVISSQEGIGQELFQSHNHKNVLSALAISFSLRQLASCGDNQIKIHDLADLKEVYTVLSVEEEKGVPVTADWTDDGQLLTTSTNLGGVYTYLMQLPQLGEACGTRVAYLTALLEVTVVNSVEEEPPLTIECPVEPSFVSLGPFHLAVGLNNRAWYTDLASQGDGEFTERSYFSAISDIKLNGFYAAVLSGGKIELHEIDSLNLHDREGEPNHPSGKVFPEEDQREVITCFSLMQEFLIYGTEGGTIAYFFMEDWQYVSEFRHVVGISKLYSDGPGTRLVFIDEKSDGFLYYPVTDKLLEVPNFLPSTEGVLWEMWPSDKNVFVTFDKDKIHTYVCYRDTMEGPRCVLVGVTSLPFGYCPLLLYNGELTCQKLTGKLAYLRLASHSFPDDQDLSEDELKASFKKCLVLERMKDSWSLACAIDQPECWHELVSAALYHLDIELAIRASQQLKDIAMVNSLGQILHIEDRNLLAGNVAMFSGQYGKAQELFLASSDPNSALEMRCDLLQWDQAIQLASSLAPHRLPAISREYAQQLEFLGDHSAALVFYEKGLNGSDEGSEHDLLCQSGIAKAALHTGDIRRGLKVAHSLENNQVKVDCAAILEGLKLYAEAGQLYEQAEVWEKAAAVFIKAKNWDKAGVYLDRAPLSSKLYGQYAKAREAGGQFLEAAKAYERAKDYDSATRLYLEPLQLPDEAVRVVKSSQSTEGAQIVARFFQKLGDYTSALQFLVLSKCNQEAFAMAEAHGQMEEYASVIGDSAITEDYLQIAHHFEQVKNHFKSGLFFMKAKAYKQALHHLLQCPDSLFPEGEHIHLAIEVVGVARQETLTQQLQQFLLGESGGVPREAKHLFAMYLALGEYKEATQTAVLVAKDDQMAGNYRIARDTLFQMYCELRNRNIRIPADMKQSLMLLHSYLLVKSHAKRGDHLRAARLLIRVANSISKFPSHVVPILTSTVIECNRSGLKQSSFNYAAMLMRPEYRSSIDPKWKKKIEQIVRRPEKSEEEDPLQPCPFCSNQLAEMRLDCPQCKNSLPYCVISGRHMVKNDWGRCPNCHFPALYSELCKLVEETDSKSCPLCNHQMKPDEVQRVENVEPLLKSIAADDM